MSRYEVPDALVCLGGAGIEIGQEFMSQEWILREVMEPDPHPNGPSDEGPQSLDAYFVDTALEDEVATKFVESDREEIETFDDLVESIRDDLPNAPDRPEVHEISLTERTRDDWLSVASLTSEETVRNQFAPPTKMRSWWLNDDTSKGQEPILKPVRDNFKQGVQRRRGLTKALYRISQADDDPIGDINTAPDGVDYVAMLVGLGGGSGSGLKLDVARRLAGDADVTLFAMLPRPSGRDGASELRNTYAALSELEYLTLRQDSPFTNIVLLPYGAADNQSEFDTAVVNSILAYYNLHDDQTNMFNRYDVGDAQGPARYAPFTVAVPQVLQFLKEDIEESKRNFKHFQDEFRDAQAAEKRLYERLDEFIDEYYEEAADANYSVSDETVGEIADDYITALRDLVDQPVMDDLGYDSAENYREQVDRFVDDVGDDESETRRLVEQFPNEQSRSNLEPAQKAENENEFVDLLYDSLRLASRRLDLYEAKSYIRSEADDDEILDEFIDEDLNFRTAVADDLEKALGRDDTGSNRNLTQKYHTEVDDVVDDLSAEVQAIEYLNQGAANRAESRAESWRNEVDEQITTYWNYKQSQESAEERLDQLKDDIQDRLDVAKEATKQTADDLDGQKGTDFDEYEDLNDELSALGIDEINSKTVETAVKKAVRARKSQLKIAKKEESTWESVKGVVNMDSITSLRTEYRTAVREADDDVVEGLPEDPGKAFDPEVSSSLVADRKEKLDTKDEDLREDLLSKFSQFAERPENYRSDLETLADEAEAFDADSDAVADVFDPDSGILDPALKPEDPYTASEAEESLEDALDEEVDWQSDDPPEADLEAQVREEYEALLAAPFGDALSERKDVKEAVEKRLEAFTELSGDPEEVDDGGILGEEGSEFANNCDAIRDVDSITIYENPSQDAGAYLTETRPDDPARIGTSDDLSGADLLDGGEEQQELSSKLRTMIDRTLDTGNDFFPLREYKPDAQHQNVDPAVYNQHRGDMMVMSRLFDDRSEDEFVFDDVEDTVREYFDFHDTEGFVSVQGEFADAWDVCVSYFVGGIFLDNLEPFQSCRSQYLGAWEEHAGKDYMHPLVARHTFGVDGLTGNVHDFVPSDSDGAFTHRDDLLNPSHDEDVAVLQGQDELDVVDELLSYHTTTGFDSVVPGMNDGD